MEIQSPLDGTVQRGTLRIPTRAPEQAIPLIIAPHPFGWAVEEDYHGGYPGLRAARHRGWLNVAGTFAVAVFQPDGHHRAVERCSLGYSGVLRDVLEWIDAVDRVVKVDRDRVYAGGLSMGALEAVLMLGTHPTIFAAGFAMNPVFDVEAWYEDLVSSTSSMIRDEHNDVLIAQEVGGTPAELPAEYLERGAFSVLSGLRRMPLAISWTDLDLVVPRQESRQGKRLHDDLKKLDPLAPVVEHRRPAPRRTLDDRARWAIHEAADYQRGTSWLLAHRRPREAT